MSRLVQTVLDFVLSLSILAIVIALLVFGFNGSSSRTLGRLWANTFKLESDNACPQNFGNAFWFACASQVRAGSATAQAEATNKDTAPTPDRRPVATKSPPTR